MFAELNGEAIAIALASGASIAVIGERVLAYLKSKGADVPKACRQIDELYTWKADEREQQKLEQILNTMLLDKLAEKESEE